MPKDTFNNLSPDKKERILAVLKKEFESKPFSQVNVKSIVTELNIARGSFYQYFENLEDSYFTILQKETVDIHSTFMTLFNQSQHNLFESLEAYGPKIAEFLYQKETYALYKNRYLYWTADLEATWKQVCHQPKHSVIIDGLSLEMIQFIKAIVHSLIKRLFEENWSRQQFLNYYHQHIQWIKKGITL